MGSMLRLCRKCQRYRCECRIMNFNQTNNRRIEKPQYELPPLPPTVSGPPLGVIHPDFILALNHAKLLYVLERIRVRTARGDVFHTHGPGSDCHAECLQLEVDGLVRQANVELNGVNHHAWESVRT